MITSRTNPQIKYVRKLQTDKRFRHDESAFVVEGSRWLRELAQDKIVPQALYATKAWAGSEEGRTLAAAIGQAVTLVDEPVMAAMSDTETPAGVLAVLAIQPRPLPARPELLLILDALNNPGNLGTILRTAAAAGVDGVLLGPGSVDPYNPKVVRGSMGAVLRLPVLPANWEVIQRLVSGMPVWLAAAGEGQVYTAIDWRPPSAILIGSEARGVGTLAERVATGRVTIPMHNETESLNAAMAAGILMFEVARQRTAAGSQQMANKAH